MSLTVLITNNSLEQRAGTELYVRDVALGLRERGHTPIAFSTRLGEVARDLAGAGITAVDDLNRIEAAPDIIHGQYHLETMMALLHFPGVPAISVCHSAGSWLEVPPDFPRVRRYVAVDRACRDWLIAHQVPEEKLTLLYNFVDLRRFRPRSTSLPPQPQRALLFSNYATAQTHLPAVREACRRAGLHLDIIGDGYHAAVDAPEALLGNYDIVFAKARCAIEAMAVGAAVVLCDFAGAGPMVTAKEFDQLRPLNFGARTLLKPLDPSVILSEINRYDAADAAQVSRLVRNTAALETVVDRLLELYEEARNDYHALHDPDERAEGRAAAAYLGRLKTEFAAHAAASLRLRARLERVPLVGRAGIRLIHAIVGKPG